MCKLLLHTTLEINQPMKIHLIVILGIFVGCMSCKRDDGTTAPDCRNAVVGDYSGIRVSTSWNDADFKYDHDTTFVLITLSKSAVDSIIDITFTPPLTNEDYSFIYRSGQFVCTTNYHAPQLTVTNDSLYCKYQGGLAPIWDEFFAKKVK